jgi:conjugal transfer pilus assembly protein TraW
MIISRLLLGIFILIASHAEAKDLGTYGEVWEIKEKDVVEEIKDKLFKMESNGLLEKHNKKILEKTRQNINRPKAFENIKHTIIPREYRYDPTYSYPQDLKDHKGQVFYKAGTKVNPFDHISLSYELLLLDGDSKEHVTWAVDKYKKAKIKPLLILVKGEPLNLSKTHNIHIYFDQYGHISKKLGIKQVPAVVAQEGKQLLIQEIKLEEAGYE